MPYCPSCGTPFEEGQTFCMKCGSPLDLKPLEPAVAKSSYQPYQAKTEKKPELVTRKYWLWLLLSVLSGGLFGFIYLFVNFQDLTDLQKYPTAKETPKMRIDFEDFIVPVIIAVVLTTLLGIIPIVIPFIDLFFKYHKFKSLYNYLEYNHSKEQQLKPISGRKFLLLKFTEFFCYLASGLVCVAFISPTVLTTGYLLAIVIVCSVLFFIAGVWITIYLILAERDWQEAFNQRVLILNPNAEERLVF